ncbi:MAG TPA: C25 family cysteine peptidase [Bacteroidales bacterium]|nr:C25 family cysteine peptidase [Bacteroidales bacterium]
MKKIFSVLITLLFVFNAYAQLNTGGQQVFRSLTDNGIRGIGVAYLFSGTNRYEITYNNTFFVRLGVKDFTFLKEIGKPALPARYDIVLIPDGAQPEIVLKNAPFAPQDGLLIYPALRNATDRYGDPDPEFTLDSAFYQSNTWYPENPVTLVNIIKVKGISLAVIQVCPVQYNPQMRKAKIFSQLDYEVKFSRNKKFFNHKEQYSAAFLNKLQNLVLNNVSVKAETDLYFSAKNSLSQSKTAGAKNYIIITHSDYLEAADSLAKWKNQLGYSTEIVSRSSWTSPQVKSEIQSRYQSWSPKPDYVVILGDHDQVPGEIHQDPTYGDNFATDLYYACMDGASDYVADLAFGRISVSSATEAMTVVNKIISYEKNPPVQPAFYSKGVVSAYFQDDDDNSYEDRRFVLTNEEIRNYMQSQQGFTVDRIFEADTGTTPLYYNNGLYANSEPLPAELLRSNGFAWDGDKNDIAAALNSADGRLFLAHRDHGYVGGSGWASPEFVTNDINMLNNGNKLPVVFSINCHTGEYQLSECFSEKFLRKANGGAVGVFGAAYYSWSGFNDGLIAGMFDAIWASPGLVPNLSGNGDDPVGSPVPHEPVYTMGDVLNQGIIRMIQTWGDDKYTHELFHYFGDPAMKIWTAFPGTISASHQASIACHDTSFTINTASCSHCLATLVVDGELIASDSLNSTPLTLHFPPVLGSAAVLTISKHNFRPYIANIPFTSTCLRPDFNIAYGNACVGQEIDFTDASGGDILTYNWDFGADALPLTANTSGPFQVVYSSPGMKIITLTIVNGINSETYYDSLYIDQPCIYYTEQNHVTTVNACQGMLLDNGSTGNYIANSNDTVTISALGAASVTLNFVDFDVEPGDNGSCNYDYLEVFDGSNTSATLIGKYCNLTGNTPPPAITSTGSSITLHFYSDGYTQGRGYEIDFNCATAGLAPSAAFIAEPLNTCDGLINFTDLTTNSPVAFLWNFGDGDTSNLQNPSHNYLANGNYTVSLKATNAYGDNTFTRINYISVQRPDAPDVINDTVCGPAQAELTALSEGTINWYDDEIAGSLVYAGDTLTTAMLDTITTYYAESVTNEIYTAGAPDTLIGSGGYYTGTTGHYLIFNCLTDLTLVSVDVYANLEGNRTIKLQSGSGADILDTIINLALGKTTIFLNWSIPAGTNYRLVNTGPVQRLFRNSSGAVYPYTVNDILSITGNSYNSSSYYYFYNWNVQAGACKSVRVPVTAFVYSAVPDASFTFSGPDNIVDFTNSTADAYSYEWDFGDGHHSVETSPTNTFTSNGSYIVTLTATNSCGYDIFIDTVDIYSVGITENGSFQNLSINPNPATESIVVTWESIAENLSLIEISDTYGQQLFYKSIAARMGINSETIDLSGFAQGVYLVKMISGNQKSVVKLVVL